MRYKSVEPVFHAQVFGSGTRYQIEWDEAAKVSGQPVEDLAWLRQVPCRVGHFYIHGRSWIGYFGLGMRLRASLLKIPGVKSWQTGDEEFTVIFSPDAFKAVARVVKPKRRRGPTAGRR